MTARDRNKPASGDRIPYVYIHNPNKAALQGIKIETQPLLLKTISRLITRFTLRTKL